MLRRIVKSQDFAAAFLFLGIGAAGLWLSSDLAMGTPARMGPGFFPVVVSVGLLGTGALLLGKSCVAQTHEPMIAPVIRPLLCIIGATLIFGWILERSGLVISVVILVVIARMAESPFQPARTSLLAVAAALLSVVVFRDGLGLPLRVWP